MNAIIPLGLPAWLKVDGWPGGTSEVVIVDGVRVSRALFKYFADDANRGRIFRLVQTGETVTVKNLGLDDMLAMIDLRDELLLRGGLHLIESASLDLGIEAGFMSGKVSRYRRDECDEEAASILDGLAEALADEIEALAPEPGASL